MAYRSGVEFGPTAHSSPPPAHTGKNPATASRLESVRARKDARIALPASSHWTLWIPIRKFWLSFGVELVMISVGMHGDAGKPAFLTRLRARAWRWLDLQGERESGRAGVLDSTSSTLAAFTNPPGADSVARRAPEGGAPWTARHSAANAVRSTSAAVTW